MKLIVFLGYSGMSVYIIMKITLLLEINFQRSKHHHVPGVFSKSWVAAVWCTTPSTICLMDYRLTQTGDSVSITLDKFQNRLEMALTVIGDRSWMRKNFPTFFLPITQYTPFGYAIVLYFQIVRSNCGSYEWGIPIIFTCHTILSKQTVRLE